MSLQVNVFILLFGLLQAILLSFILLKKKTYRNSYIFLVIYLLVLVLQIAVKVMNKVWLTENLDLLYSLSYKLPMLYGPLVYLLSLNFLNHKRTVSLTDSIHLTPFIAQVLVIDTGLVKLTALHMIAQISCIALYHFFALREWNRNKALSENYHSPVSHTQVKWLCQFIIFSFVICVSIAVVQYIIFLHRPELEEAKWGFALLTIFVYWVSFVAFNQPEVFTDVRHTSGEGTSVRYNPTTVSKLQPLKKYKGSGLSKIEELRIIGVLKNLVATKKPYLNPVVTLDELAEMIPCQRHHLSQVLNDAYRQSFYEFINHLRVNEAKLLLSDPHNQEMKIIAIAFQSGFNSISSFNEVFKKTEGNTPSQFRKQALTEFSEVGLKRG